MSTGSRVISGADTAWAFEAYEVIRHRLPNAEFPDAAQAAAHLEAIADEFDVFLLDAFGVLNIGETAIPGVAERIDALRALGKQVIVVTNAAGYPSSHLYARYDRLGYSFAPDHVISSRKTLLANLGGFRQQHWGVMASPKFGHDELPTGAVHLEDDPAIYDDADAFLMLGASAWNEERHARFVAALKQRPRDVLVGNPDLVAPVEDGLSCEPGHYAHRLADETGIMPRFFGKPFGAIFELARAVIRPGTPDHRVVMVGDTLHTDILGGRAAGFRTALIQGYGFFDGTDPNDAISRSGIVPDFILKRP